MSTSTAVRPGPPIKESRARRLRTFPARLWWQLLAILLALGATFTLAAAAIGDARSGLTVVGHGSGPQAVATAELYFALSDMDAQVSQVLLMGREHQLGIGRTAALERYSTDRDHADQAALRAAGLAGTEPADQQTVQQLLYHLGRYEQLTDQAMVLNDQSAHPAGPATDKVLDVYRQATEVMKVELLPRAYNLTLNAATVVRHDYLTRRGAVQAERFWAVAAGALAVVLLVALQVFCSVWFRRLLNVPLLLATAGVIVFTAMTWSLLGAEVAHLDTAKTTGFDATLTLSRARAIGNRVAADETTYLLDPSRAAVATETYLEESLQVLYLPPDTIPAYDAGLGQAESDYAAGKTDFLGFLGVEARSRPVPGGTAALRTVLGRYRQFQSEDLAMRTASARGDLKGAIALRTGSVRSDFDSYDAALVSLTDLHQTAYRTAVGAGERALDGWDLLLPITGACLAALVIGGIMPRLREFR